jgi:hypothetical protein
MGDMTGRMAALALNGDIFKYRKLGRMVLPDLRWVWCIKDGAILAIS